MTSAASLFLISYPVSRSPAQQPKAAPEAIRAAIPTPRPLVIVAAPEGGVDYENAVFANLYDQVNPSVVNVTLLSSGESLSKSIPHAMVPGSLDPEGLYSRSSGSGFVWDSFGHIVTNNHVVDNADELQVTFSDGRVAVAEAHVDRQHGGPGH